MSLLPQPFPAPPLRPSYHTGMLLDAEDFRDEQGYHRGQLARLARWLHGLGTVCGLEVKYFAAREESHVEETLEVRPGVAIDRLGRILEVPKPWCLRLPRWFDYTVTARPDLAPKLELNGTRHLLADVFLRFLEAPQGLRPGFPEAAVDATDAIVASRLEDAFELALVARPVVANTEPNLPDKPFDPPPANRDDFLKELFKRYEPPAAEPSALTPLPEHPPGFDPTAVFLARVRMRLLDDPSVALEQLNAAFGLSRTPQDPFRNLSGLFVVGLRAVEFSGNPVPVYPPSLSGETQSQDGEIIEASAVTLVPYHSGVSVDEPLQARARVAREIFLDQKPPRLPTAALPLAMVYLRAGHLEWVDEFLVRREAGDDDRFGFAFAPQALAEAHFFQYQDLLAELEARQPGRFAASDFFEILPPGGPLPRNVINPTDFTQAFFPAEARLELALVPEDELPSLMAESIALPPIDLSLKPEDNDAFALLVLAPVPRRQYAEALAALVPRRLALRPALAQPLSRQKPLDYLRGWKPQLAGVAPSAPLDSNALPDAGWVGVVNRATQLWYVRRRNLPDGSGLAGTPITVTSTAPAAPGATDSAGVSTGDEVKIPPLADEDERLLATLDQEKLWGRYALLKAISPPPVQAFVARLFSADLILENALLRHALMTELEAGAKLTSQSPEENFEMIVGRPNVKVLSQGAVAAAAKTVLRPELVKGLAAAFARFEEQLSDLRRRTVLGLSGRLPQVGTLGLTRASDPNFQGLMTRVVKSAGSGRQQAIRDAVDKFIGK